MSCAKTGMSTTCSWHITLPKNCTCEISTVFCTVRLCRPVSEHNGHVKLVQELHLWELRRIRGPPAHGMCEIATKSHRRLTHERYPLSIPAKRTIRNQKNPKLYVSSKTKTPNKPARSGTQEGVRGCHAPHPANASLRRKVGEVYRCWHGCPCASTRFLPSQSSRRPTPP